MRQGPIIRHYYRVARMDNRAGTDQRPFWGSVTSTILAIIVFWGSTVNAEQTIKSLQIGYVPLISQLPLVVSYDNDRLRYSSVNVTLVKYRSFNSLEAALRVGAVDIADLPIPVVFNIAGDDIGIKIIGQYHSGGSILEGTKFSNVSEFRGKIIGVPGLRSNENLTIIQRLSEEKLRYGLDYKTLKVPFNTVLQNLEAGKINAMYFPEPYGSIAEKNHLAIQMEKQDQNLSGGTTTVLVARSDTLQTHSKEAIEEWIRSLTGACAFIENDISTLSAEQTAIIQEPYFGFERALVSSSLVKRRGGIRFFFAVPEKKMLQLYLQQALDAKILLESVDIDALVSFNAFSWEKKSDSAK